MHNEVGTCAEILPFKLYCMTFFSKICASKSGVRLIYRCGLYMDIYGNREFCLFVISSYSKLYT